MSTIKILGICGSLRKASVNLGLLRLAAAQAPPNVEVSVADISELPLFNEDLEENLPRTVLKFYRQLQDADAYIFSTPEYNGSLPGPLKNAIDFGSRRYGDVKKAPFAGKPVALMGAAGGGGAANALSDLKRILKMFNCQIIEEHVVGIQRWGPAGDKADASGNIRDPSVHSKVKALVTALTKSAYESKGLPYSPNGSSKSQIQNSQPHTRDVSHDAVARAAPTRPSSRERARRDLTQEVRTVYSSVATPTPTAAPVSHLRRSSQDRPLDEKLASSLRTQMRTSVGRPTNCSRGDC